MTKIILSENEDVYAGVSVNSKGHLAVVVHSAEGRVAEKLEKLMSIQSEPSESFQPLQAVPQVEGAWDIGAVPSKRFSLCINGHPFAKLRPVSGGTGWDAMDSGRRFLTVSETRFLGAYPLPANLSELPIPAALTPEMQQASLPALTDLHTHLSGQISAHDIISIAENRGIGFPVKSLQEIGIDTAKYHQHITQVPFRVFPPEAHLYKDVKPPVTVDGIAVVRLNGEDRQKLERAMCLSAEKKSTYGAMEHCYHLREPITKELKVFGDVLRKVAEDYQKQGVKYAEPSTNAVLDPGWLAEAHKIVPDSGLPLLADIEDKTGVAMRFLAGVPRNLPEVDIRARLEQIKLLKDSPYIAGIDWLGFENNKTDELAPYIREFAQWMHDNRPDWVMRIHAGENGKNRNNVMQALQLAEELGIRVRIGHGLYGMREETLDYAQKLAQAHREDPTKGADIVFEVCPDSNLANNHFEYLSESTIKRLIDRKIPAVLSTDGASLYQTTAKQTALSGVMAGLTADDFQTIRKTEQAYMKRQQGIYKARVEAYKAEHPEAPYYMPPPLEKLSAPQSNLPEVSYTDELPNGDRKPLLIAGANGTTWDDLSEGQKAENIAQLRALILGGKIDPEKVYLVMGRGKQNDTDDELVDGIEKEVLKIVNEYNQTRERMAPGAAKLECYSMVAEDMTPNRPLPEGMTGKWHMRGAKVYVADNLTQMVADKGGMLLAVGGMTYTRDMALLAHEYGMPSALSVNACGASAEKARVYPDSAFGTIQQLAAKLEQWLPGAVKVKEAESYYADQQARQQRGVIGK